jgi:hypothetical protein
MMTYMEKQRALERKMRNEFILGTVVIILAFVMMIMAMRLWG